MTVSGSRNAHHNSRARGTRAREAGGDVDVGERGGGVQGWGRKKASSGHASKGSLAGAKVGLGWPGDESSSTCDVWRLQ